MTPQKWLTVRIMIIAFVFVGVAHASTADNEPVGNVVAIRGDAQAVDAQGQHRKLTLKASIFRRDVLQTSKNGRLQILFKDQTVISLGRNTEMEVVHYAWRNDTKIGAMTTRVKEGAFRIMGGAITKNSPENFLTETPAATIGVRGSLYAGIVDGDLLSILFQGGTGLDIITPVGSVPLLTPGFGCKVTAGNPPSPPSEFSPAELQRINNQLTPVETPPDAVSSNNTKPSNDDPVSSNTLAASDPPRSSETPTSNDTPTSNNAPNSDTPLSPITPSTAVGENPLESSFTDIILTTSTTSSQTTIYDQTVAGKAIPQQLTFTSGQYLNTVVDNAFWYGPITGVSDNGIATGQSVAQDSTVFPISFPFTTSYSPATPYTGHNSVFGLSRTVNLLGTDYTFTSMAAHSGTAGEFGYFTTADFFTDTNGSFNFSELGFAGQESSTLPTNGISVYIGEYLGTPKDITTSALLPAQTGQLLVAVNWHNGKVYGFVDDGNKPLMQFYGDVTGNSLTGVNIISDGADAGMASSVTWYEGTQEFARFYGNSAQGFGISALGYAYDIETQGLLQFWRMAGAAFQDGSYGSPVSPTGVVTLDGMVVGISEDMTFPNSGRRLFMSHPFSATPTTFSITVDRDAGVITAGELNALDLFDPVNALKHVDIGITQGAAYLNDNMIVAGLGCVGSDCIETQNFSATPDIGGLKTHGNYLATDGGPTRQIASHVSWGYWEIAYDDPTSGLPYHLHMPYSLWIAGEKTPAADITAKGISTNFTGHYLGKAYGSRIDSSGFASELTGGVTDLTVDFRPTAPTPISGTLSFDQANLTVVGTAPVTPSGFQAQVSGATIAGTTASSVATSEVNGFFFGPGAISSGGNFSTLRADGERLLGIWGGDLQP